MAYIVTVNMPGYMPECERIEAADWNEAVLTVLNELRDTDNRCGPEDDEAPYLAAVSALSAVPPHQPFSLMLHGYAHNVDVGA